MAKGQKLENVIEREISCFQQITHRIMSYNVDELERLYSYGDFPKYVLQYNVDELEHLYSYKEFLKYILQCQQEIIERKAIRAIDMYLSSVHFAM